MVGLRGDKLIERESAMKRRTRSKRIDCDSLGGPSKEARALSKFVVYRRSVVIKIWIR